MPKPAHTRVTFSGVVGTAAAPVERWSINLNFPAAALPEASTDAAADTIANNVSGWWAQLQDVLPTDVILTEVRVAAIGADGLTLVRGDGTYVQGIASVSLAGAMAKQPMPLQTALCVSLNTTRTGPTGKGRFFLPWPALSLDSTTKILPEAQVTDFIDDVVSFLNGVQNVLGQQLQVVSSKGYMSEVTSIRIGRAPDTMRSRREDVPEGYITAPLA